MNVSQCFTEWIAPLWILQIWNGNEEISLSFSMVMLKVALYNSTFHIELFYVYVFLKFSTSKEKSRGYSAYCYSRIGSIKHVLRLWFVEWVLVSSLTAVIIILLFFYRKTGLCCIRQWEKSFSEAPNRGEWGDSAHVCTHPLCR